MPLVNLILNLSPKKRLLILILIDSFLFYLAFLLGTFWFNETNILNLLVINSSYLIIIFIVIGIITFLITGQYKGLTRFVGSNSIYILVLRNGLIILLSALVAQIMNIENLGLKFWLLVWILLTSFNTGMRLILKDIIGMNFSKNRKNSNNLAVTNIAIYGAGSAGNQLAEALKISNRYDIKFFIDDSAYLFKRKLNGINIYSPKNVDNFIEKIDQVFLAIPSISRIKKREIFEKFNKYGVCVLEVPSLEEIASGEKRIESVRNIKIEDLLGREIVNPDPNLFGPSIRNKNVFVTGAGGSIGRELCIQILKLSPASLTIIDNSEPNLYEVNQLINNQLNKFKKLTVVLGDVTDEVLVQKLISKEKIDIIFHAAAYKHVPLVESNPISALKNNVNSTHVICKMAFKYKIPKVVLISSDKAVRPSNIMGATKRLSEMIFQAYADISNKDKIINHEKNTNFSMVRFGNVLGSSGSVVPLFKEQILKGGPITVTHPDIIRYFMTIAEAAQLVIQSSELSHGGDLFLLDMGDPVLIKDLAEQMIRLYGFTLKNKLNPNGDIEISYTGLRPGEKLFEELLINATSQSTKHPLIYRANEKSIETSKLFDELELLEKYLNKSDKENALIVLKRLIPEWKRK